MILEEIKFDNTEEDKKKAILENIGREVIIKDFHHSWCHGKINEMWHESSVYAMVLYDGRKAGTFHYHDLEKLIVVGKYEVVQYSRK
jgi:hypothetical protein